MSSYYKEGSSLEELLTNSNKMVRDLTKILILYRDKYKRNIYPKGDIIIKKCYSHKSLIKIEFDLQLTKSCYYFPIALICSDINSFHLYIDGYFFSEKEDLIFSFNPLKEINIGKVHPIYTKGLSYLKKCLEQDYKKRIKRKNKGIR